MNTTLSKGRTVRMTGTDTPTADPHRKRVTIGTLRISSSIADIVAEKYVSSSRKFLKWQGSNAGRLSLSMRKPAKRTYVSESEPKACLIKFSRFPSLAGWHWQCHNTTCRKPKGKVQRFHLCLRVLLSLPPPRLSSPALCFSPRAYSWGEPQTPR